MLLKTNYTKKISLETGIVFCQRNFMLTGSSSNQVSILRDNSSFGYINYSSPIKGIVYVQLNKYLFMRNSIGFNIDYYASAVASKEQLSYRSLFRKSKVDQRGLKRGAWYRNKK